MIRHTPPPLLINVALSFLILSIPVAACFIPSQRICKLGFGRWALADGRVTRPFPTPARLFAPYIGNELMKRWGQATFRRLNLDSFDFSTKKGWDKFYEAGEARGADRVPTSPPVSDLGGASAPADHASSAFEFEWHGSIPHSAVIDEVTAGSGGEEEDRPEDRPCLMVGCGNSGLPPALYDATEGRTSVTGLDSSQRCIEAMRDVHGTVRPGLRFVCGDATDLKAIFNSDGGGTDGTALPRRFGSIVDKGLVDALMCSDGWNRDVASVITGASDLLDAKTGIYVLVSYRLSSSTKVFLRDVGDRCGLVWEFDIPGKSNSRVSFSVARRQ